MKKKSVVWKALGMVVVMTLLCGVIYTAVITCLSQVLFSGRANGSILEIDGKKYGCELLAQQFTEDKYLWGRIMNLSPYEAEDGTVMVYSGPSNLSPNSSEYAQLVEERVNRIKESNPHAEVEQIPVDLVTCSGSGLDPDISLAAAKYQIPRIAEARGLTQEEVEAVIEQCTSHKLMGILGEDTVNVLEVNLRLEGILE